MRQAHVLFSALHFFLLTALCLSGVCCILLFLSPFLRYQLSQWLADIESYELLFTGMGILLFGLLLIFLSTVFYRTQYYQVQMGFPGQSAQVDLDVVRSLVSRYWQNHFPSLKPQVDVLLRDDATLELFAELPIAQVAAEDEHKTLLQKIEADLSRQLARHLGYRKPFFLTIKLLTR
jgi:hypothetical protein